MSVEELRQLHHQIEDQIDEENRRPNPDDIKISSLKKEKLRIKDEILKLDHAS